jgi:integrase
VGSELTAARIEELDLVSARWIIPSSRAKNHRQILIPLSEKACELLRECVGDRDRGYIFPSSLDASKPQRSWNLNQAMRRLLKQADIEHATLCDLRRTVATLLGSLGYNRELIKKILNHARVGITDQVYALYDCEREKRVALEELGRLLDDFGLRVD